MTQQAVPAFPGGIWEQIVLPALESQWFAAWLARNAGLLQELQLKFHEQWQSGAVGGTFSAGVPVAVAGALNIAAVRGRLQNLQSWVDHMPSPVVLSALAGVSSLTRLQLDFDAVSGWYGLALSNRQSSEDSDADDAVITTHQYTYDIQELAIMHRALAGLNQLRELSLHWSTRFHHNVHVLGELWPALRHLRQLTALTTTYFASGSAAALPTEYTLDLAQYLPSSLQKVVVLPARFCEDTSLGDVLVQSRLPTYLSNLAHLTCLTELRAPAAAMGEPEFEAWGHGYWPRASDDNDGVRAVLPASLEVLQLGLMQPRDMAQLLQLSKMQTLAIERAAGLSQEQLQEMDAAHGGCLTSLQLRYCAADCPAGDHASGLRAAALDGNKVVSHGPYWPMLPLRHLSIDSSVYYFPAAEQDEDGFVFHRERTQLKRYDGGLLPAAGLPHLAQLSGLTYLGLKCDLPRDFCVTLAQLTGLQELRLAGGFGSRATEQQPEGTAGCSEELPQQQDKEALQELLAAAAELPQLKIVALQGLCGYLGPAAAEGLARAAQLQRVELWGDSGLTAAEMQAVLVARACKGCVVVDMPHEEGQQLEV
ncbi:hypothetical protein OEZ86_012467 [Tetradesmus obliquus]|nr:hypothetical protein OEZ86_012467 [Tetradesmus obliquus]